MRKFIPLHFVSHLLLIVMLSMALHGVHECDHTIQGNLSTASDSAITHAKFPAPQQSPCTPPVQHKDSDGCDTCVNCACHAPLIVQQLVLSYDPIVVSLRLSDPYHYLPEVFLSKFIPPQNLA